MIISNNKFEFSHYNLVNEDNKTNPNYDLSNKDNYFQIYISPEKEVCILGSVDDNYIGWCSLTELNDKELNSQIFNYIANNKFTAYSNEYNVLNKEKYYELQNWYRCYIRKSSIKGILWETPFGHYYGDNGDNKGDYFANDISKFYDELIKKCNFRIGEGAYVNILKNYLSILKEDSEYLYYLKMKPLISILEGEQYLKLSPNKEVRDLYLECLNQCSSLYNKYMNVAR